MSTPSSSTRDQFVVLSCGRHAQVKVYLQGAHVAWWRTESGREPLYMSRSAVYADGVPLRGGIPVCWPQFGAFGPCPRAHGFARNSLWKVVGMETDNADTNERKSSTLTLALPRETVQTNVKKILEILEEEQKKCNGNGDNTGSTTTACARQVRRDEFEKKASSLRQLLRLNEVRYYITLQPEELTISLGFSVADSGKEKGSNTKTDDDNVTFTAALHTYLHIGERLFGGNNGNQQPIQDLLLTGGLVNCAFWDSTQGNKLIAPQAHPDHHDVRRIAGETNRIYHDVGHNSIVLASEQSKKSPVSSSSDISLHVSNGGSFRDVVLWNPWVKQAALFKDMGDDDYKEFVCIEAAAVNTPIVVPSTGEEIRATQTLSVINKRQVQRSNL